MILELDPRRIYPGHGPVIVNPGAKIREYIAHRMKREEAILGLLPSDPSGALSASDIVKSIYTVISSAFPLSVPAVSHHCFKLSFSFFFSFSFFLSFSVFLSFFVQH